MTTLTFEAIGTSWQIDINQALTDSQKEAVLLSIKNRIELFDKAYSRFRDDSLVSLMAKKAGTYELPPDAENMFALYRKLYDLTEGKVTPLIGQVLVDAGYDANYSLIEGTPIQPKAWDDVFHFENQKITLHEPALLDFGAAGKGYLVDIVAGILKENGFTDFCVDAGGDLVHESSTGKLLQIGLEHPDDKQKIIGVVSLPNGSICGSAGNRRVWGKFHHIIDPELLYSPTRIKAVWVTTKSALLADGLTTALFFVPPAKLTHFSFEYAIVYDDLHVEHSPSFPATFF